MNVNEPKPNLSETREQWLERARLTPVERDAVPPQVAIEMLCRPKIKMSSRERRMFRNALEKHFTSAVAAKPREDKLAFKLQHSTFAQLNKWLKRTASRYAIMQSRYSVRAEKVAALQDETPEKVLGERSLAAFRVVIGNVEQALDCLETEADRRAAMASAADKIPTEEVLV